MVPFYIPSHSHRGVSCELLGREWLVEVMRGPPKLGMS